MFPVATYRCESWTILPHKHLRIKSFFFKNATDKCLETSWTDKRQNIDKQDLNIKEHWLINSIMFWKLKYLDPIKHYSGLDRTLMEDMISGR
uniref:Uncharacterized protein n=1 Tax=Arion vulgaris TaxID=1028688 RepID=A0A0B7B5N1_9EUPU